MPQIEHNLRLIKGGDFTGVNNTIEIPDGKVWEILGFRFEMFPKLAGERLVYFSVDVRGGVIFESFAPILEITEQYVTSGSASVITGLRGVPTQIIPTGFFTGAHAIFQMPDQVILPSGSRLKTSVKSTPIAPDEIKRVLLLVEESMEVPTP